MAGVVEASMIGTFVLLNADGWILTAAHITRAFREMTEECEKTRNRAAQEAAIKADASLKQKERYDRLKALGKGKGTDTENCSAWWGQDLVTLEQAIEYRDIDLCVAKLKDFDVSAVPAFPTIKDGTKDVEPGVSLCRMGFPFHSIQPTWDKAKGAFEFPPGSLPLPLFPIEGMLTRTLQISTKTPPPIPFQMIETSSPGLKGQSGGPIFDTSGTVWAIQSATMHLALGFDPPVPNGGGRKEHQFLNVGIGPHPLAINSALDAIGVAYTKSAY